MNLRSLVLSPVRGVQRLGSMVFRRDSYRMFWSPRSSVNYQSEVGDGLSSSTVAAPILWVARTFPEAPPKLWSVDDEGIERPIRDHPLLRLLQRPNQFFTGPVLWMATTTDWQADGNAYWIIRRSRAKFPAELWWVPSWMIEPKSDRPGVLITHYEYTVDGVPYRVEVEDMVHFRFGIDPDDARKGYSPLKSVLREVYTDNEAAAFTAALLRNMGVPGLVISPDGWDAPGPSGEEVAETKEYIKDTFAGDRRGEPLVLGGPTKVEQFGFNPEQLTLRELRRIPEERVTAVLGIPAIVAGLGAGLDRSTFTNMGEAREAAYEAGIIPMQRILAEEIRFQLLTEWLSEESIWTTHFGFDLSKVRVLQEDVYRQGQRHDLAVRGGWEMVSEARRANGLPVDEARDNIFLRAANMSEVNVATGKVTSYAPARGGSGSTNGNGRDLVNAGAEEPPRLTMGEHLALADEIEARITRAVESKNGNH